MKIYILSVSQYPKFTAQKINKVIRNIFTAIAISVIIFSCNNKSANDVSSKVDTVLKNEKSERNTELVYLILPKTFTISFARTGFWQMMLMGWKEWMRLRNLKFLTAVFISLP